VIDTVPGSGDTVARMTVPAAPLEKVRLPRRRVGRDARRAAILLSLPFGGLLLFFVVPVVLVALHSVGALTLLPSDRFLSLER
jgi:hypothetical protein